MELDADKVIKTSKRKQINFYSTPPLIRPLPSKTNPLLTR
jgi:hypothetical protein